MPMHSNDSAYFALSDNAIIATGLAAVLVAIAAIYWPSLGYEYVYDDRLLFLVDRRLRDGWHSLFNITMPVVGGTTYLRPAVLLSFVAEFSVADGVPRVSRSVNLLIHLVNCLLVGLLARRCVALASKQSGEQLPDAAKHLVAIAAALAYGLHPSLVESTAWVSGRFDLMVTTFSLLALLLATRAERVAHAWAVAVFVLLALFSKEMAITLPALIWIYRSVTLVKQPLQAGEIIKHDKVLLVAIAASAVVYMIVRFAVHPDFIHTESTIVAGAAGNLLRFALVIGATLMFYLRLLVYPYRDTNPMHPVDFYQLMELSPQTAPALFAIIAALLLPLVAWKLRSLSLWLFVAVVLSLLPVLNIVPLRLGSSIGENRFLTFPLALLICALAYSFVRAWSHAGHSRRLFAAVVALIGGFVLLGNTAFVHAILPVWRSDSTLFASCFAQFPENARAAASYLRATMHTSDRSAALARVERTLEGKEVAAELLTPYATTLALEGHRGKAVKFFEQAQAIKDDNGLDDMNTIARYAEVRQSWNEAPLAEPLIARAKAIRAAKAAAGDDYLISHLDMRQALLLGDPARFAAGYALLNTAVPPDMQLSSRMGMTTFRKAVCENYNNDGANRLCGDEVWASLIRQQ